MLMTAESGGQATTESSPQIAVIDVDLNRLAEIGSSLETRGYRLSNYRGVAEAISALRGGDRPALLILAGDSPGLEASILSDLRATALGLGILVLDVVEPGTDAQTLVDRHQDADGWVFRSNLGVELPLRVELLLRRREQAASRARPDTTVLPRDSRFFPLIVHDLRTPLNVIGLSLRMIDQALPRGNAELEEDLRFVEENFKQIERMLSQLSDYCRLFESESPPQVSEFSPERLLAELVEARALKAGSKATPVRVDIQQSCPAEASLDPIRARQAIQYALSNALAASNGKGIRIAMHGGPDRWVTEFEIDQAPPPSVKATELRPHLFERLCGIAAERRGMDLAITARISEMFGGAARLDVDPDRRTTIVLDWPARIIAK